jgi:tetratricopeptide (TPR) repeat protein
MASYRKIRKRMKHKHLLRRSGKDIDIIDIRSKKGVKLLRTSKKSTAEILDDINRLKDKIAKYFNCGKINKGYTFTEYLIENQNNNEALLIKSLCDLSTQINDREIVLYILEKANSLSITDQVALTSYGKALADNEKYDDAYEKFEQCLELFGPNVIALTSYGKALADNGKYEDAYEKFEQCLEVFGPNAIALTSYGKALADNGKYDDAYEKFEQSLELFGPSDIALNSYGKALADNGNYDDAYEKFEQCLELFGPDEIALNSYGKALADNGNYDDAYEKFEQCLELFGPNEIALTSYGKALADNGKFDEAYEKFEQCLELFGPDEIALTSYGKALADNGKFNEAIDILEQCLEISPNNQITLLIYAMALEQIGKYETAANRIETIIQAPDYQLDRIDKNFFHFILGRLYYFNKQKSLGDKYFELAISNAPNADRARLRSAKMLLQRNPFDKKASELLLEIAQSSDHFRNAAELLSINLSLEKYFYHFSNDEHESELKSKQDLYNHILHKITNQVVLTRLQFEEIMSNHSHESCTSELKTIQVKINSILTMIEKEKLKKDQNFNHRHDYRKMLEEISKLSHLITDKVSNKLYAVKMSILFLLDDLNENDFKQSLLTLTKQIEASTTTLNNLKSINEGIYINNKAFLLHNLFENIQSGTKLDNAIVHLTISEKDQMIMSDPEKIREMVNELIENSIRHNAEQNQIQILIVVNIVSNPKILMTNYYGEYLNIVVKDNGIGIPKEKKNWIFMPLNTTSRKGTGLGLFIIKKTLEMMNGIIYENGTNGVKFNIFIPLMED